MSQNLKLKKIFIISLGFIGIIALEFSYSLIVSGPLRNTFKEYVRLNLFYYLVLFAGLIDLVFHLIFIDDNIFFLFLCYSISINNQVVLVKGCSFFVTFSFGRCKELDE